MSDPKFKYYDSTPVLKFIDSDEDRFRKILAHEDFLAYPISKEDLEGNVTVPKIFQQGEMKLWLKEWVSTAKITLQDLERLNKLLLTINNSRIENKHDFQQTALNKILYDKNLIKSYLKAFNEASEDPNVVAKLIALNKDEENSDEFMNTWASTADAQVKGISEIKVPQGKFPYLEAAKLLKSADPNRKFYNNIVGEISPGTEFSIRMGNKSLGCTFLKNDNLGIGYIYTHQEDKLYRVMLNQNMHGLILGAVAHDLATSLQWVKKLSAAIIKFAEKVLPYGKVITTAKIASITNFIAVHWDEFNAKLRHLWETMQLAKKHSEVAVISAVYVTFLYATDLDVQKIVKEFVEKNDFTTIVKIVWPLLLGYIIKNRTKHKNSWDFVEKLMQKINLGADFVKEEKGSKVKRTFLFLFKIIFTIINVILVVTLIVLDKVDDLLKSKIDWLKIELKKVMALSDQQIDLLAQKLERQLNIPADNIAAEKEKIEVVRNRINAEQKNLDSFSKLITTMLDKAMI